MPFISTKVSWKEWVIVFLVFAPLLFINVSASHDWGDDFAQYILQAKCIVEGKSPIIYAFFDKEFYYVLGPPTRPVGLPLLLAPVYYFFGNNMLAFSCLMSVCYFFIALLIYRYLRHVLAFVPAILWACTMLYNPQFLQLKLSVLSDFPFIVLLLLFFQLMKKTQTTQKIILLSLLAGFIISFRLIGIVLLPVYAMIWLTDKSVPKTLLNFVKTPLLFCTISLLTFLSINSILLSNTSESISAYSFISTMIDKVHLLNTINYYAFIYTLIYDQEVWGFASIILKSVMVALVLFGGIISWSKRLKAEDWFVIFYLLAMFVYPYNAEAVRFLMPVFPMLLMYQIESVKNISIPSYKLNRVKMYIIPIMILLSYKINLQNVLHQQGQTQKGPQEKSVAAAFDFIKTSLPANAMYAFTKHHAFMLYTDRKCVPARDNLSQPELRNLLNKYQAKYLLYVTDVSGKNILKLVQSQPNTYKLIAQNKRCKIFERL